jgi:hypothetical protein
MTKKELAEVEAHCKECYTKGENYLSDGYCICGDCCWHYKAKGLRKELNDSI